MIDTKISKIIASMFMIWLCILLPIEISHALSFTTAPDLLEISHDGATIQFLSDIPAKGTVTYGNETPTEQTSDGGGVTDHRVKLTGLLPDTIYYYYASILEGNDTVYNPPQGRDYLTFTTRPPPDTEAPHAPINMKVSLVGTTSMTIEWGRDPADDDVESYNVYFEGNYTTNTRARTFTVSDLEPETSYNFEVTVVDTSDNEGPKASLTGKTISENMRSVMIGQIGIEVLGTTVTLDWDTDFPTNALVQYGKSPEELTQSATLNDYNYSRIINLTDLEGGTTYSFMVIACDEYDNCRNSSIGEFTTGEIVEMYLELESPAINTSEDAEAYYHKSYEMDIKGRAAPYSDIFIYVNDKKIRFKRLYEGTSFTFNAIRLSHTDNASNTLKIEAKGFKGEVMSVERKIIVDRMPPEIKNVSIPDFTSESSITISGNITDSTDVIANLYIMKQAFAFHVAEDEKNDFPDYYKQQGAQTKLTYDITKIAEAIEVENGSSKRDEVRKILDWVHANMGEGHCEDPQPEKRIRPAKELLDSNCLTGCIDYGLAFMVLARARGIPAKYVETVEDQWVHCVAQYGPDSPACLPKKGHIFSEVWLEDEGIWVAVDPAGNDFTEKDVMGHFKGVTAYLDSTMLTLGYARDSWELGIDDDGEFLEKVLAAMDLGYSEDLIRTLVDSEKIYRSGGFSVQVGPLIEAETNHILVEFVDQAGNVQAYQKEVIYDTTPPKFVSPTSLEPYTPSYVWEINIEGQVDDFATVYAFVNEKNTNNLGDAQSKVETDANGTFSIPVKLALIGGTEDIDSNASSPTMEGGIEGGVGLGVPSKVVLVAVDKAEQRSDPIEGIIAFGQCSEGIDWKVTVTDASPSRLNTRELLEGIATFGFAFNLSWQGGGSPQYARVQSINLRSAPMGTAYQDSKYDMAEDYLTTQVSLNPRVNNTAGVVVANFKPVREEGNTTYEKEKAISDRGKDGKCWTPGVGCFRFLLMMEVNYAFNEPTDSGPYGYQDSSIYQQAGVQPRTIQKHCFPIEIIVDERFDPSMIPNSFLNATVEFLGDLIYVIEKILGPLTTITKYVLIGCLVTTALTFVWNINKQFSCKWGVATSVIESGFSAADMERAAEQGLCEVRYPGDNQEGTRSSCESCKDSVDSYWGIRRMQRFLCDRVICPSVPTFQHYIQAKGGGKSRLGAALNLRMSHNFESINALSNFITAEDVRQGQGSSRGEKNDEIPNQLALKHDCLQDILLHKDLAL
ncbi:fibronectin type III domain-containing protein, partial [Thermoproteota archaeon]